MVETLDNLLRLVMLDAIHATVFAVVGVLVLVPTAAICLFLFRR